METNFYQHIERLNSDEVEGILNGKVDVFTKLDGTNIGIHYENGAVKVNSRKRLISIEKDNAGSCQYVMDNPKFEEYLKKHPDHYLYGEFLVKHTIKTYREDAWRKVYVFDVVDYSKDEPRYLTYEEYKPLLEEYGIEYVPRIASLENPSEGKVMELLDKSNYLQANANDAGEGIVLKNYEYHNKYGRQIWAKVVRTEFKAKKKTNTYNASDIESMIIDQYLTVSFIEKELAKVLEAIQDEWNNKYIGRCLNTVWHEFIVENSWDIVKKYKNPTVHYGMLYVMATEKIKNVMAAFFKQREIKLPF